MTHLDGNIVTSIDGLAEHYAAPTERVVKYELDHVNSQVAHSLQLRRPWSLSREANKVSTVPQKAMNPVS